MKAPKTPSKDAVRQSTALALDMGWKLLVALVLPVVAGRYLDAKFTHGLVLTIIGLVIGLASTIIIVMQTVRELNTINGSDTEDDA